VGSLDYRYKVPRQRVRGGIMFFIGPRKRRTVGMGSVLKKWGRKMGGRRVRR
jgi:hypothetical protein